MDEYTEKYGHVWGYMEGIKPTIVLSDVEMMKEIYIKEFSKFHSSKVSFNRDSSKMGMELDISDDLHCQEYYHTHQLFIVIIYWYGD